VIYIGIDPGTTHTGVCAVDPFTIEVDDAQKIPNEEVLNWIEGARVLADEYLGEVGIEDIVPYSGRLMGNTTKETIYFIGVLRHELRKMGIEPRIFPKSAWASWLAGARHMKDADVRAAIANRWGGECGKKGSRFEALKNSDIRSAFGVAMYTWYLDEEESGE
jgi:hypothetical protein